MSFNILNRLLFDLAGSVFKSVKKNQRPGSKLIKLCVFLTLSLSSVAAFAQTGNYLVPTSSNTYTLSATAKTSAGIYTADSVLIRTLWSNVSRPAGTYKIEWDGKDNLGNRVPNGNYIAKIVTNNVKYTWMGIIGNTSDSNTGNNVHRGVYYFMTGMTIVNGAAYYCSGYSEGRPSIAKFLTAQPQKKLNIEAKTNTTTANTDFVVSDGSLVYWAGVDPYATSNTWVFANKVGDDSDMNFSAGITFKPKNARSYNAIGYVNTANSLITGLAVQKKGNLLFISRKGLNTLTVLNKLTGKLISTVSVKAPEALCTDGNDNLWMVTEGNKICKYTVSTLGKLSDVTLTIAGVTKPIALAVSPDNKTLAIADGDIASQQVKAFNNLTGSKAWTLGEAGGYVKSAAVNNNKFYFNDVRGKMYASSSDGFLVFIAFQPDGSFWVNDPGNYRTQHYSAQLQYLGTVMAMGTSYSSWADKNDNTSVGAEYLEFKLDNSAALTGKTGWTLSKNWGANIPSTYDRTAKFTNVITLTSGGVKRKYGVLRIADNYYIVEFGKNDLLRFTGISRRHFNIDKDGAILTDDLTRYAFIGFDSSNNPKWSPLGESLGVIAKLDDKCPLPREGFRNTYLTSTGKIIFYSYGIELQSNPVVLNTGFHLGAIQRGVNRYLWKTAKATHRDYTGEFPDVNSFDIGNMVNNYAGSSAMVLNRNVITGYHGESWKNNQTNMYNHYLDNGLAIGQFGTFGPNIIDAAPMMAGNALSPQLVSGVNADEAYLFHGDESYHGGMHKWKITGLSTIREINVNIKYPSTDLNPVVIPGNNLMVNLPYDQPLTNNTAGWTMSPAKTDQTTWNVRTNAFVSGTQNSPDIFIKCKSATGVFSLNRSLGNTAKLNYWRINGEITFYGGDQQGGMRQYVDVLDPKGKIIARLTNIWTHSNTLGQSTNTIYGNDKVLVTGLNDTFIIQMMYKLQPLIISESKGLVTIKYAGYTVTTKVFDPSADVTAPATLRAYFTGGINPTGRSFGFKDMRFSNNLAPQSIDFKSIADQKMGAAPFNLISSSSANLPVSLNILSGQAAISGNTITVKATGTVTVKASQNGNDMFGAAAPVTQTFKVMPNVSTANNARLAL